MAKKRTDSYLDNIFSGLGQKFYKEMGGTSNLKPQAKVTNKINPNALAQMATSYERKTGKPHESEMSVNRKRMETLHKYGKAKEVKKAREFIVAHEVGHLKQSEEHGFTWMKYMRGQSLEADADKRATQHTHHERKEMDEIIHKVENKRRADEKHSPYEGRGHQTKESDYERDWKLKALPPGRRVSDEGKTYYEFRRNRTDKRGTRI